MHPRPLPKLVLLAAWLGSAGLATAELLGVARGEPRARIEVHGSARCPARPDFEAAVERLVGPRPAAPAPEHIDVRLFDAPDGVHVELRVERGPHRTRRVLVLASCGAAHDAAVLLTALSIDPTAKLPEPPGTEAPPDLREGPAGPDASSADGAPNDAGVVASEPVTSAEDLAPSASAGPAPEVERPAARGDLDPPGRSFFSLPALVRVTGALDPSQLGGPSGLLGGELGLGLGALEAALGARTTLPHTLAGLPAGAEVSLMAVHTTARAGVRWTRGPLALIPSATLGLGVLRARADNVRTPTVERALSADLGLGAQAEWALSRHFALDLGAELVLPLRRVGLALDGSKVFELPAVAGRITVGLRYWTRLP